MIISPPNPKIYHILHVDRLASVVRAGALRCDAEMTGRADAGTVIGMEALKAHRLNRPISCHDNLMVGQCVPFYFCSRSVMLYVIHRANHASLAYRGGQRPILHLEADLNSTVAWANDLGVRWAFSLGNASTNIAEFRNELGALDEIDWTAVQGADFSSAQTKDAKQAEFLVEGAFPWRLVTRIGVMDPGLAQQVADILVASSDHRPAVEIQRGWYY